MLYFSQKRATWNTLNISMCDMKSLSVFFTICLLDPIRTWAFLVYCVGTFYILYLQVHFTNI
jgi:hypothetical protein